MSLQSDGVALLEPPTQTMPATQTENQNTNLLEPTSGGDTNDAADLLEPPVDTPEEKAERLQLRLSNCGKTWVMRPTLESRGWKFAHYECGHRLKCMRCGNKYAVSVASNIFTKVRSRRVRGDSKLIMFTLPTEADASELVSGLSKSNYFRSPTAECEYIFIDPSELPNEKLQEYKKSFPHEYITNSWIEKAPWGQITATIESRRPSGKLATLATNNAGKTKISSRIIQTNAPLNVMESVTAIVKEKTKHLQPTDAKQLESAVVRISELVAKEIRDRGVQAEKNWYATVGVINAFVDLDRLDWTIKDKTVNRL